MLCLHPTTEVQHCAVLRRKVYLLGSMLPAALKHAVRIISSPGFCLPALIKFNFSPWFYTLGLTSSKKVIKERRLSGAVLKWTEPTQKPKVSGEKGSDTWLWDVSGCCTRELSTPAWGHRHKHTMANRCFLQSIYRQNEIQFDLK